MYKLFLFCFGVSAPVWLWAQSSSTITGRVTDAGKPVFAATVALISTADSTKIKAGVTDSSGSFAIAVQPGNYRLQVSCIGYVTYRKASVTIAQTDLDLGAIRLTPAGARQLSLVTISGKKPFAEHKIDRTVINVDALVTNQGTSAYDVLEKSPGVMIDPVTGSISLEGKQGAAVYINDKLSYLTGNDLAAFLQSLHQARCSKLTCCPTRQPNMTLRVTAG